MAPMAPLEPQQTLETFTLRQSYQGRLGWEMQASQAWLKEDSSAAILREPRMQIYQEGRVASRLRAAKGFVQTATYDIRLSSQVVVNGVQEQAELSTDELHYSDQKRKFFTDKPVLVKKPGSTMRGRGLEATADLSEITIFDQKSVLERTP